MAARSVKETKVFRLAFELAMDIFEALKNFPREKHIH